MCLFQVEAVSLAFDFLKDETSSIFTENDGNIEHLSAEQQNKPAVFRFRPPQISAITKYILHILLIGIETVSILSRKIFSRNNNNNNNGYQSNNDLTQSNSSSRDKLDTYYNHQYNHHPPNKQYHFPNGQRARSETRLYDDEPPTPAHMHLSPHYGSRLAAGSGAPITTNPIWNDSTPIMVGSQPNLLSYERNVESAPLYRQFNPLPSQTTLYGSYPDTKPELNSRQQDYQQKRLGGGAPVAPHPLTRQHNPQSQYLDTNEFILRASNGQPLRNAQFPNRNVTRDYRPHSMDVNGALLDVYY